MSLTSASAREVPMGPSHEDATVTVQSSLMDVGIANCEGCKRADECLSRNIRWCDHCVSSE